ncbi:hypothetical protein, partial [Propionicimonas sp.]|uniref:hypothetical protein n=1 Tax=Propionicimonas sp. TaxID=1955623 RepID=UPI0039E45D9D
AQTTRRASRGRREDPKPAAPSPVLLAAHAHEHAPHVDAPELPLPEPVDELAQAVAALLAPDAVPELAPAEESVVVEAVVIEEPVAEVVEAEAPVAEVVEAADAVVEAQAPAE